jgi:DMSO/TMAO reductase YedYZ molybdopterin-dependent catalytic subunit
MNQPDTTGAAIGIDELSLATRIHGMPLEALRYDVTPVGLHYLLIHYDIPLVDPTTWRLRVEGSVRRTLDLSLDDVRSFAARTQRVTMECAGNGRALHEPRPVSQPWLLEAVGTAEWTGVPVRAVLDEAGLTDEAVSVAFRGLDRGIEGDVEQPYERGLSRPDALDDDALLAYAMNGQPLPPQHGFPLRLVVPGWYGMTSVKWLSRIEALDAPFDGYQNRVGYRWRATEDDPGEPLQRIAVRSLMAPPGIPLFLPRTRHLAPGPIRLEGRAWSGTGPVTRVEVSTDAGATWADAQLAPEGPSHAWRGWTFGWGATPGTYELCSRATDVTGATQPTEPVWNVGGYTNNAVQRVPVVVEA